MKSRTLALVLATGLGLTAIILALGDDSGSAGASEHGSNRIVVGNHGPADVGQVVCAEAATLVKTPVVGAHRDGVRLQVGNPAGAWGIEFHHESWDRGSAVGSDLKGGKNTMAFSLPPGKFTVACLPK